MTWLYLPKTGIRTTSYNPIATTIAEVKGAARGLSEWGKDIKNGVDTSPTQHEMPRATALKSKLGAGAEIALNKILQLGDRPFFEAAYAKRIDELKRLGLDYQSADSILEATQYALEKVFQNDSNLSKKASSLRRSLGVMGDVLMPFVQTPANIFDKLMDYSPYGFVRAIKMAGSIQDSAWSQKQFVDTLSRTLTGTGIIAFGLFGALKGLITAGDDDKKENELYQLKQKGWQPYSVFTGDKSYTYDWMTVAGALLSIGATAARFNREQTIMEILRSSAAAGINVMFNQSYLSGLSEFFQKRTQQILLNQCL